MAERFELPGHPVEKITCQSDHPKYPFPRYIWRGLHMVRDSNGKEHLADSSCIIDAGKQGQSFTFIKHQDHPLCTREEVMADVDRLIGQMFPGMGLAAVKSSPHNQTRPPPAPAK